MGNHRHIPYYMGICMSMYIYCFCIYIYGFIHDDILIDCCLLMLNKGQSLNMGDISIRLKLAVVDDG
jgi:hypothetical protein